MPEKDDRDLLVIELEEVLALRQLADATPMIAHTRALVANVLDNITLELTRQLGAPVREKLFEVAAALLTIKNTIQTVEEMRDQASKN